jgi:two-component system chemotaxis sensor kinase CheA
MDFLEDEIVEILNIFREESDEQIQKINKNLLKLEANPKDMTAISELFREAHSLKGAARMIGLNDIQAVAHKLEDVFGLAREYQIKVTPETVDILCHAVDYISSIVEESIRTRGKATFPQVNDIIKKIDEIITSEESQVGNTEEYKQSQEINSISSGSDFPRKEPLSQFELEKIKKENKTLITQIRVNIEKIKIFSSGADSIEELLHFIIRIHSSILPINNHRLTGLIEDIRMKLETSLKGSCVLTSYEINEIEENFETFSSLFARITETPNSTDENQVDDSPEEVTAQETEETYIEKPAATLPEIVNEVFPETDLAEASISPNYIESDEFVEDLKFISNNITIFSVHSEENIKNFETVINKLYNLANKVQDNNIQNIINKIAELLEISKDNDIPINSDIVKIVEESFESAVLMINAPDENQENPILILQRIAVLQQMLRLASSEEQFPNYNQEKREPIKQNPTQMTSLQQNTEVLQKNIQQKETDKFFEAKAGDTNTIKTLRVDTKKLDQLVSQVGELIIAKIKAKEHLSELEKMIRSVEEWHREWNKTKVSLKHMDKPYRPADLPSGTSIYNQNKNIHTIFEENSGKLSSLLNKLNYLHKIIQEDDARLHLIVSELEERIKSVRVLPLATIFHMFPRMVRDIAREKNKNIELIISGSETSVDKKIIEEIKSPLIHIIRNSIDHGIEDSQTRISRGKNPIGKIFLAAYHLENSVLIEIIDDGNGINIEAIKRKVIQKQLLSREELASMTEEQIMNIIFWPGFSTGEMITDISGRGIGLDIVYTKIAQLNGKVKIKSTLGEGCRVSIQLPVTMATIKSFLVEVNRQKFAIPTSTINTTLLVTPDSIFYKEGKKTILVNGETVPICNLAEVIEYPESKKKNQKLVVIVVQSEDIQVGFIVDKLIGDQEILHKNLSAPLLRVRNIAGITTLGSGELCLILNVGDLIKSAYSKFGISERRLLSDIYGSEFNAGEKNVLVVDDSLTTRILERNILKAAGYNVTVANNGLEALTKLVTENFDLIVSDVEMPEINGFELTERVREDDKFKNMPIVLVTSLVSESDKRKGLNLGANAYITKDNFNQDELLDTIRQLLQNHKTKS